MKARWAKDILSREWALDVAARIYARKQNEGREPTEQQILGVRQDKSLRWRSTLTEEDVTDAYCTGKEVRVIFFLFRRSRV